MRKASVVVLLLADVLATGSSAQTQRDRQDRTQITTLTVRLPVAVKEKGKFVVGLQQANFEVYEDGKWQAIDSFSAPSLLPLNVAILMDTSESVKLKLPFEKDAAEDFVSTILARRRKDQVLFGTFDSDVELHQDFTDSVELLAKAVRKVKAGGVTRLHDAVYRVVEEKMSNLQGTEARRVIVIISDGEDTASERRLNEAIEIAQRYDVTVFGVSTKNFTGIASGMVESEDDKDLRRLCEETGGQLFLPNQKAQLFQAFTNVAADLRSEYVLFYTPKNQEKTSKRRDVDVKLVGVKGRVHHKEWYVY